MNLWEMQPSETAKAFHAFGHYRDMAPADRSIDAAHAEHLAECEARQRHGKRTSKTWQDWSSANRWVERAAAHDADLSRQRRERKAADLEKAEDAIDGLATSGLFRLAQFLNGMDQEEISANNFPQWFRVLVDTRLKVLGHQDKVAVEHSGPGGGPLQQDVTVIVDALTDPETRNLLKSLNQRLEGYTSGDSG